MPRIVRLRKDPIVDAVCEARFIAPATSLSVVLPGILASEFKTQIASIVQTPAATFPEQLAQVDASLAYAHKHRLISNDGWAINVADRAVSVGFTGAYPGWQVFRPLVERVFKTVFSSGMAPGVERFSTKYVNFFEGQSSASEALNVGVSLGGKAIGNEPLLLRAELKFESIISVVQVLHPAQIQQDGKGLRSGLVLDIDTVRNGPFEAVETDFMRYIQEIRDEEKRVFFSLLTDATLQKCEPDYE